MLDITFYKSYYEDLSKLTNQELENIILIMELKKKNS